MEERVQKKKFQLASIRVASLKTKLILIGVLFFIALLLWYAFDRGLQSSKLARAKRSYQALSQDLHRQRARITKFNKIVVEVEKLRTDYNNALTPIPPKSKIDQVLNSITRIGNSEELKFVYFKPQKEKDFNFYTIMPINIAVTGDYHHIARFISRIANLKQLVVVGDFTIVRKK